MKLILRLSIAIALLFTIIPNTNAQQSDNQTAADFNIKVISKQINLLLSEHHTDSALVIINNALRLTEGRADRQVTRASLLESQARAFLQKSFIDEAIAVETEAINIYASTKNLKDNYVATAWFNLATYYFARSNPADIRIAIDYAEKALPKFKKTTDIHLKIQRLLQSCYTKQGRSDDAQKAVKKTKRTARKAIAKNPDEQAGMLSNESVTLAQGGKYKEAVDMALNAIGLYEENDRTFSLPYCKTLCNTAAFYIHLENYAAANELLEKAKPILLQLQGENGTDYRKCLISLADTNMKMGNLELADDYTAALRSASEESTQSLTLATAHDHTRMAGTFAANGNYSEAIAWERKAINVYGTFSDSLGIADSYKNIASYYTHLNDTANARHYISESIRLYNSSNVPTSQMADALNSAAIIMSNLGDTAVAYNHNAQALRIYESLGDTLNSKYAKICSSFGLRCYERNDLRKALEYTEKALRIQQQTLGASHPDNVCMLHNLAVYGFMLNDPEYTQRYFHNALTLQMELVRTNFLHLSAVDRERFWNTKKYVFQTAPMLACMKEITDTLAIDVYNALLFTKGILLNSEVDFKSLLRRDASPDIQQKYEELSALYTNIERMSSNTDSNNEEEVEAKLLQAEQLEREIVKGCRAFGDFTKGLSIRAEDIMQELQDDEVAVELFDVDVAEVGTTYMAMYLKKGDKAPHVVQLFHQKDLDKIPSFEGKTLREMLATREGINKVFADTTVTQLVWQKLTAEWHDIKHVYFAPTGIFYQWGVEYLACPGGEIMSDLFNFHRLSSTRTIAQRSTYLNNDITEAAIFGGVDYGTPIEDMIMAHTYVSHDYDDNDDNDDNDDDNHSGVTYFAMADPNDDIEATRALSRGSIDYLPGTLDEVETIHDLLTRKGIAIRQYTFGNANEEAFKQLSGSNTNLLHIATHGFSFDPEKKDNGDGSFLNLNSGNALGSDNLAYSGLLLSGASHVIKGEVLPDSLENGILTASEIAKLDLRNLSLVVLSACQTGLGVVKEDGVFGLQRGFKKAGAKALVMSLWSVADDATSEMMTGFYEQMAVETNRSSAFKHALERLRKGRFREPYLWASFIMLDELENH